MKEEREKIKDERRKRKEERKKKEVFFTLLSLNFSL
jgi:hypothetical protein